MDTALLILRRALEGRKDNTSFYTKRDSDAFRGAVTMKIMYLNDVGLDTPNSNNHLVITMLKTFLDAGNEVYLVESHTTGKYDDVPAVLKTYKKLHPVIIEKKQAGRTNFVKRYLNSIFFEYKAYRKWKKFIKEIDVVLLQSHYTATFSELFLKKHIENVVFYIFDIFPGEAYINGNIKNKFVFDCLFNLQKIIYKNCRLFLTLTEDTKRTLVSLGVDQQKIAIVPNWFDESVIKEIPRQENKFIREFNLDDSIHYIQYAGTLGVSYDFDLLFRVAVKLKNRKDIVFQIVGDGIYLGHLMELAEKESLSNIQFIPWQPIERLSDVYSACTLQIVPMRKQVIKNSYPSKILPLMACGRVPVISVDEDSWFYEDINRNKVGIAVPLDDEDGLANGIIKLIDNRNLRREMQSNAKNYVGRNYASGLNTRKMLNEFYKLIGEKTNE